MKDLAFIYVSIAAVHLVWQMYIDIRMLKDFPPGESK